MKAVIIGSTLDGIAAALRFRKNGCRVDMLTPSTFVCEDYTGVWKYFPDCKQKQGIDRLNRMLLEFGYEGFSFPILPGMLKKRFCEILCVSGVNLHYMSRAVGIVSDGSVVSGVLYADKAGLHTLECDAVIDASLYGEFTALLQGKCPIVKKGNSVSLLLEYNRLTEPAADSRLFCGDLFKGVVSEDSAYVRVERKFDRDLPVTDARDEILAYAARCLPDLVKEPALQGGKLQSAFSPCIDVEIDTEETGCYKNVYKADRMDGLNIDKSVICGKGNLTTYFRETDNLINTDVLVIGGGTAGIRAAIAAAEHGARVCLAEFFPTLGGTRTVGNIQPPYYGNRNDLFLGMWKQIIDFANISGGVKEGRTSPVSEALLYEKEIKRLGIQVLRPAIAYEAAVNDGMIDHVSFATELGCVKACAKVYIDATGDGDIAMFAGVETLTGSDDIGITQNYSQTHRYSGTGYDKAMADQDIVDINDTDDLKRALDLNNMKTGAYDITEMMTVRESRRIRGKACIKLSDVFRGRTGPDTIYEAMSDYDTHSRCFTISGRFGVLAMHAPIKFTSVPYGALLPETVDNLIVCGKAISVEQDLVAYLRMCPDVMCIGYAAGMAAALSAKNGILPARVDITQIQRFMLANGGISHEPPAKTIYAQTPQMIAMRLAAGEEMAITDAILCDYPELVDQLHKLLAYNAVTNLLYVSEILLYYGDKSAAPFVAKQLCELNKRHGSDIHSDYLNGKLLLGGSTYYQDTYWQMNLMVMLLAKAGCGEYEDIIYDVLKNAVIGEDWSAHKSPYMNLRPDTQTHGNFDRMLCLAYAVCMIPSKRYADEIVRLVHLNREANTMKNYPYEWLDIKFCEAAYLCGAKTGESLMKEHLNNRYSIMRKYACKVLGK